MNGYDSDFCENCREKVCMNHLIEWSHYSHFCSTFDSNIVRCCCIKRVECPHCQAIKVIWTLNQSKATSLYECCGPMTSEEVLRNMRRVQIDRSDFLWALHKGLDENRSIREYEIAMRTFFLNQVDA